MSKSKSKIIGITLGDPAGIGPEVIAKALSDSSLEEKAHFVIIGNRAIFHHYAKKLRPDLSFLHAENTLFSKIKIGSATRDSAKSSLLYLDKAVELLKHRQIDALVTAPVCKEAINALGVKFHGHTEYLAQHFNVKRYDMMFVTPQLRTIIVTRHIPVKKISPSLSVKKILETIVLADLALKNNFQIRQPLIGICGLNPHAGEGGVMGNEEKAKIIPAINQARHMGIKVTGPLAADTAFYPQNAKKFDIIVAMYHDQGLIPVKTLYFQKAVNLTIGLPFIRTSPAHGTAFDIAGKNKADASSMHEAIQLAASLA